jgi:hypothetical protein
MPSDIGPISSTPAANVLALASDANAATIVTGHNALLASLKAAGLMLPNPTTYDSVLMAMTPLCYWILGEAVPGTGAAVDAMGLHNGAYVASPSSVAGLLAHDPHTAVQFNGSTQWVTCGVAHFLSGQTNASIVIWFSSGPLTGTDRDLYAERSSGNDIFKLVAQINDGRPHFVYRDDAGTLDQIYPDAGTYANNGTHCFVVTKAGTALILYADGAPVKNATLTASNTFTDSITTMIGTDPTASAESFPGVIGRTSIFNRALTPTEVAALYAAGTT